MKRYIEIAAGMIFGAASAIAGAAAPVQVDALAATAAPSVNYPVPPSTAVVFTNAQFKPNTGACIGTSCAGGTGTGASWIAQNQTTPSLSGRSTEFYNHGEGYNSMWYWHVGAHDTATHIEFNFSVRFDTNSLAEIQALEFGPQQYINGYKYSMTMQCEWPKQLWRVWNQAGKGWTTTTAPCPHFTPNVWHTVQMYMTTDHTKHSETYHTVIVDGKAYPLEVTVGVTNVGFKSNVGFQFQIDNNKTVTSNGVHEWVDKVGITVW